MVSHGVARMARSLRRCDSDWEDSDDEEIQTVDNDPLDRVQGNVIAD